MRNKTKKNGSSCRCWFNRIVIGYWSLCFASFAQIIESFSFASSRTNVAGETVANVQNPSNFPFNLIRIDGMLKLTHDACNNEKVETIEYSRLSDTTFCAQSPSSPYEYQNARARLISIRWSVCSTQRAPLNFVLNENCRPVLRCTNSLLVDIFAMTRWHKRMSNVSIPFLLDTTTLYYYFIERVRITSHTHARESTMVCVSVCLRMEWFEAEKIFVYMGHTHTQRQKWHNEGNERQRWRWRQRQAFKQRNHISDCAIAIAAYEFLCFFSSSLFASFLYSLYAILCMWTESTA